MEVLSQWTFIEQSCKPLDVSHMTAISIATDSSQPMSLTANCQPSVSFHEAHLSFIMRPIPHKVDASTQMSRSDSGSMMRAHEGLGMART